MLQSEKNLNFVATFERM